MFNNMYDDLKRVKCFQEIKTFEESPDSKLKRY